MSAQDDARRYRERAAELDRVAESGGDVSARLAAERFTRDAARAEEIARRMTAERD